MKNILIACSALLAIHASALAGGEGWTSDFAAAKTEAAAAKKDLLMDFTGSDWCGWCKKLDKEVFQEDAFKAGVKDKFVLVEVDFPKDTSGLSEATRKQNDELGEKYGISGYPTILLCDAQGRPYARTGYQEGGAEKYVAHLDKLRASKAKRDEAFAAAEKLEGVAKAQALLDALAEMGLEDATTATFYGDVIKQIEAADPKDETGFKKRAETAKRLSQFETKLQELGQAGDMDGALALVDETIAAGEYENEITLQLMMTRAIILAEQGKFDDAIKAVDQAKEVAPDSEMTEQIDAFRAKLEAAAKEGTKDAAKDETKPAEEAGKE